MALRWDREEEGDVTVGDIIRKKVIEAQKASIKLPFIRKVVKDGLKITLDGEERTLKAGQSIVCDIVSYSLPHAKTFEGSLLDLPYSDMY